MLQSLHAAPITCSNRHVQQSSVQVVKYLITLSSGLGRWYKVVRMVVMRQRCIRQGLKDAPVQPARVHTNTVPFQSFFGSPVSGPQFSLVFIMHPPAKYPGHPDFKAPPPAELDIEVCCRLPGISLPARLCCYLMLSYCPAYIVFTLSTSRCCNMK